MTAKTLKPIIAKLADKNSRLMTDESAIYPAIGTGFAGHESVNYSKGENVSRHQHG